MATQASRRTAGGGLSLSFLDDWWRVGGVAAIGYVILFIIGGIVLQGDTPMPDDSAATMKAYFVDHPNRYMVGDFLIGIAFMFLFLPFASAFYSFLRRAEGRDAVWARLMFTGALLFTAVGAACAGFLGALAYTAGGFSDEIIRAFVIANYYVFSLAVPFVAALMVFGASVAVLRTGVLAQWLGWYGLALTVAAVISTLTVLDSNPTGALGVLGLIAFLGLGIWLLAVGVLLMRAEGSPEAV